MIEASATTKIFLPFIEIELENRELETIKLQNQMNHDFVCLCIPFI
jgi:hypothetical protein